MSYKEIYDRLKKELTDEEIVDGYLIPEELTEQEEKEIQEEIKKYRFRILKENTEQDRLFSGLMRLRILMKDYVKKEPFSVDRNFGYYLGEYIQVLQKTKREVANDLGVHSTKLSRIINNREEPNVELAYRLEKHSGELIPAVLWWKLLVKKQEYQLLKDEETRKKEGEKVKNALIFRA